MQEWLKRIKIVSFTNWPRTIIHHQSSWVNLFVLSDVVFPIEQKAINQRAAIPKTKTITTTSCSYPKNNLSENTGESLIFLKQNTSARSTAKKEKNKNKDLLNLPKVTRPTLP